MYYAMQTILDKRGLFLISSLRPGLVYLTKPKRHVYDSVLEIEGLIPAVHGQMPAVTLSKRAKMLDIWTVLDLGSRDLNIVFLIQNLRSWVE